MHRCRCSIWNCRASTEIIMPLRNSAYIPNRQVSLLTYYGGISLQHEDVHLIAINGSVKRAQNRDVNSKCCNSGSGSLLIRRLLGSEALRTKVILTLQSSLGPIRRQKLLWFIHGQGLPQQAGSSVAGLNVAAIGRSTDPWIDTRVGDVPCNVR